MLEFFRKLATPFYIIATLLWSLVLNILLVPLSWLYSICTRTLSAGWKILGEADTYILYWSIKKGLPMLLKDGKSVALSSLGKHPQALLALFVIAVPVICICAGIAHLARKFGSEEIDAEETKAWKPDRARR